MDYSSESGVIAALLRGARAAARTLAVPLALGFASLLHAAEKEETTISQFAEGATWSLHGETSPVPGGTYTYTITRTGGTQPANEYAGFYVPSTSTSVGHSNLGSNPTSCGTGKYFCASFSPALTPGIWNDLQGHHTIYTLINNNTTITATLTVTADTPIGTTISFGAIVNYGRPRSGGLLLTVSTAPTKPPDPTPPTLVSATTKTLTIEWTHPGDGGSPLVRDYVHYRVQGTTEWSNWYAGETPVTRAAIGGLQANTAYEVRVSVTNRSNLSSRWVEGATAFRTRANTPATGAPSITGTATVGQDLTATRGTIADADGLPSSFSYQWVRVDADGTSNSVAIPGATDATYTLTDADMGKKIKVRVSFTDDLETTETLTSDAYPSGGTVTAAAAQVMGARVLPGNAQLVVTWTAVENATGYVVQWKSGSQGYNTVGRQATVTSGSTTRYTIRSLTNGTEYTVRVIATRTGAADGRPSAEVTGTPFTAPGVPRHLSGVPGDEQVTLTWDAPSSDGGSAIIRYGYAIDDSGIWLDAGLDLEETVIGLTNGREYVFQVWALNSAGPGAVARTAVTPAAPPSVPESLTATAGDGEVVLEWTEPADDGGAPVIGYEYRHAAGSFVPERSPWQSAGLSLKWTISGLTNGRVYAFEVRALNSAGPGAAARTAATPLAVPSVPESLTATAGDGEVVLEWTEPADDGGAPVTGYEYRHAAGSFVPEHNPWQSAGLSLEWTISGLTNGRVYAFEVRALNSAGPGAAARTAVTPLSAPSVPESLTATAGDGEVVLEWTEPADDGGAPVTGYEYRHAAGSFVPEHNPWQSAGLSLEWTISGLTNGRVYAFEVRALNSAGPGAAARTAATPLSAPSVPESLTATAGDGEVVLEWTEPADDGGAPVTGYEYRHAAGSLVPGDTPWQSAGLSLEWTISGLTNGWVYAFEVRALNSAGPGAAARTAATPLGAPSVPESLTATAGDGEVVLEWTEPADDGGAPVTGYEYRHAAGSLVPGDTPWQDAGTELTATVTELENETRYAFEVRARNRTGPGAAARAMAMPLLLLAELFSPAAMAVEGEALAIGVGRSGGVAYAAHAYIGVTDSAVPNVGAEEEGREDGLGRHRLQFAPGAAEATATVTPAFDGVRREGRVLTATLESVEVEIDGVVRVYEFDRAELEVRVTDADAALSVADAQADPESAELVFAVSLDRTRDVPVRVDYATEDGSARAGEDYTAVSGTLVIEAGRREAAVEVPALQVPHLTGERTLTLRLSNARNALIADGEATGTIARESKLAQAWLARFGRTASDHTAQAIARRLAAGERETQVTVAGRRLESLVARLRSGGMPSGDLLSDALPFGGVSSGGGGLVSVVEDVAMRLAGPALAASGAPFDGSGGDRGALRLLPGASGGAPGAFGGENAGEALRRATLPDVGFRVPTMKEALLGSSFYVGGGVQEAEGGRTWAAWGDVAATRFEGDANGLALDGDVTTGTVGLDRRWRALLVGLALSRSTGDGAYGTGAGTIASTLTSVHPYVRYQLGERAHVWGAMGGGWGGLEVTPESGAALKADLRNSMAAAGARAVLRRLSRASSSLEIALRSDLLWTETSSDETTVLAEATGSASRGRLLIEGTGQIQGLGGIVRPSVEGGVRYDGGDAETGAGFEVGGGLGWARGALTLEVNGRMLVAHADESYEEWGYSGSLVYEPGSDGLGLQLRVGSSARAAASGVQNLWALENASGLARGGGGGGGMPFAQRFNAEVGYRLRDGALWYPYFVADDSGQMRYGLKLSSGRTMGVGLEFGRRESVDQGPEDAMILRGELRF